MADEKDDISFGISMDASKAEASIKSFSVTLDDLAKMADTRAKGSLSSLDSAIGDVGNSFDKQSSRIRAVAAAFEELSRGSSNANSGLITLSKSKIIVPEIKLPNFADILKVQFGDSVGIARNAARDIQDAFTRIKVPRPTVADIREAAGGSRSRTPISTSTISSAANLGSGSLGLSRAKAFLDDKLKLDAAIRNLSQNRTPLPSNIVGKGMAPIGPFPALPQLEPTVRSRVASSFTSLEAYKSSSSYKGPALPNITRSSGAGTALPSIVPAPRPVTFPQFVASKTEKEDAAENERLANERRKVNQQRAAVAVDTLLAERREQKAAQEAAAAAAEASKRAAEKAKVNPFSEAAKRESSKVRGSGNDFLATAPPDTAGGVSGETNKKFWSVFPVEEESFSMGRRRGRRGSSSVSNQWKGDWTTVPTGFDYSAGTTMSKKDMEAGPTRRKVTNEQFISRLKEKIAVEEGDLYKFQLERLNKGTVGQRLKSARIPMAERQTAFLKTGSALTPQEEAQAVEREQRERDKIIKQKENERLRMLRIQNRILRGTRGEEYTNRFASFFSGQGYSQDPALGKEGRAGLYSGMLSGQMPRQGFVGKLGTNVGSIASDLYGMGQSFSVVFSGITMAFKALSSVASTVASVIVGAFKAAFAGVAIVGAVAIAGLTTAFMGVKKVVDITMEAFDRGKQLSNLSQQTGVAVQSLVRLEKAFEAAGMKASEIAPSIAAMSRSIYVGQSYQDSKTSGGKGSGVHSLTGGVRGAMMAPRMFENLGLDPAKLKKMTEVDAFLTIGKAINSLKNPTDRVSASMAIFKGNGERLLGLFANSGALDLLREKLTMTNQILAQQSFLFREAAERYQKIKAPSIKEGMGQIGVGIGSEVAGEFLKLTETMGRVDFAPIGQKIGQQIGLAMEAFRSGRMLQYLTDSFLLFKEYASAQVESLFAGTFFSPDTTEFYNNLLSAATEFGSTVLSSLDGLSSRIFGVSLMTVVDGVTTTLGLVANVFVTVATMIVSATARLAQWSEKAYKVIKGFDTDNAKAGGVMGTLAGAASGALIGGVMGIPAGPAGILGGAAYGAIYGAPIGGAYNYVAQGLRNSKGANEPTQIKDSQLAQLDSAMEQVRGMFVKLSEATGGAVDKINNKVQEKNEKPKTSESDLQAAEARTQRLKLDKAQVDFDAFKASLPDPAKQAKEMASPENVPRWAGVVASSLQEIGGGGGVYVPTGQEKLQTASEITATNTGKIAEYQQQLLQNLGANDVGPTMTGMPLGWANTNPEDQKALMDLVNMPLNGSNVDAATWQTPTQEVQSMLDEIEAANTTASNNKVMRLSGPNLVPDTDIEKELYPSNSDVAAKSRASIMDMLSGGYTAELPNRFNVLSSQSTIESDRNSAISRMGTSYGGNYQNDSTPDLKRGNEQQLDVLGDISVTLEKILGVLSSSKGGSDIIKVGL